MGRRRLKGLVLLALLAASSGAAANGLYDDVNRLRAGQGGCPPPTKVAPLKPQPVLERVARELSGGTDLRQSLWAAGYRAKRSRVISLRGDNVAARGPSVLAEKYCDSLQDPAFTEIGIYSDPKQAWLVLAAPLAVEVSEKDAGQRVLQLANEARATPRKCGDRDMKAAPPLRWNATLASVADSHAEDMARHDYFAHQGRDGSTPAQRVQRAGYRYRLVGENLAAGTTTPEDTVAGWLKSPGHCTTLMTPGFTEMGVALAFDAKSKMGVYWAQVFGTPR